MPNPIVSKIVAQMTALSELKRLESELGNKVPDKNYLGKMIYLPPRTDFQGASPQKLDIVNLSPRTEFQGAEIDKLG